MDNVIQFVKAIEDKIRVQDGDKVRINVPGLRQSKMWSHLQAEYREFVEKSADSVFTARVYQRRDGQNSKTLVWFEEEPKWLFWMGDLIVVENGGS